MARLTFGSLFSGIGGFDLGLERAGMRCRWQVEIDTTCGAVLSRHWPGVNRYEDITTVTGLPAVDVLCGGFPCQDLSVAGRRAGLAGERSGLFYEFMRLAVELRPEWLVIENVPGLLSSAGGRDMGVVLGTLGRIGYGYAYRVLDAQYFGVAQRRRRVFIVGHARAERAAEVLFEPESCNGDSPPSRETGKRPAFTIAASVRGTGDGHGNAWNSNYAVTAFNWQSGTDMSVSDERRTTLIANQTPAVAHALCSRTAKGGDPTTDTYVLRTHNLHDDERGDVWLTDLPGALQATGSTSNQFDVAVIAHTLRSEGADASEDGTGRGVPLVMQSSVRRLTPVECERLQGFPDGWTDGQSDSARYRMLGNAVCVPVAEWIGRRIVEAAS